MVFTILLSLFSSEKAFGVVGAEVLEQSGTKVVAGKQTGYVMSSVSSYWMLLFYHRVNLVPRVFLVLNMAAARRRTERTLGTRLSPCHPSAFVRFQSEVY